MGEVTFPELVCADPQVIIDFILAQVFFEGEQLQILSASVGIARRQHPAEHFKLEYKIWNLWIGMAASEEIKTWRRST